MQFSYEDDIEAVEELLGEGLDHLSMNLVWHLQRKKNLKRDLAQRVWVTKDGRRIPLGEMDENHLTHCIKFIGRMSMGDIGQEYQMLMRFELSKRRYPYQWYNRTFWQRLRSRMSVRFPAISSPFDRDVKGEDHG